MGGRSDAQPREFLCRRTHSLRFLPGAPSLKEPITRSKEAKLMNSSSVFSRSAPYGVRNPVFSRRPRVSTQFVLWCCLLAAWAPVRAQQNTPPIISAIPTQVTDEDVPLIGIPFTV